jgi:hypothetical protein
MVPIGEGRYVPLVFKVTVESRTDLMADIDIEMRGREAVCTGLTLHRADGGAIQQEELQAFPLADYVNAAVDAQAVSRDTEPGDVRVIAPEETAPITGGPRVRRRVTDEVLQEVALVYREAYERGEAPTAAVQRRMRRSRSTAGRLVMQARQRGFLGEAKDRIAGEFAPPSETTRKKEQQ